jgi:flagellar hook assembly protein FlgD
VDTNEEMYGMRLEGGAVRVVGVSPQEFSLGEPRPNPFDRSVAFDFTIPGDLARHVNLSVFNIHGQLVRSLANEVFTPGKHTAEWDGSDESGQQVSSGTFFYRMAIDGLTQTKKVILAR